MTEGRVARIARWGGWLAAAALAAGLYSHHAALERANQRLDELAPLAERTAVRDRLMGTDLSQVRVQGLSARRAALARGDGRSLVWLVDPAACAGCLSDLSGWWRLAGDDLAVTTVLVGVGRAEARRIAGRVGVPGTVGVDPEGEVASTLGVSGDLPSIFLVLGPSGEVLMAEGRRAATSCDWSFTGQVAALLRRPADDGPRLRRGP